MMADGKWGFFWAFVCHDYSKLSEADMKDVRPGMLAATYSEWRQGWLSFLKSKGQTLLMLNRLANLIELMQELLPWLFRSIRRWRGVSSVIDG